MPADHCPLLTSACVAALGLVLAACGPLAGGSLRGSPADPPPDWRTILEDGREVCEVESRPDDPHSIQLGCFLYEDELYVQSHRWALASWWPLDSWAAIWIEQPDVRVRLGDDLFDLVAVRVTDPDEREPLLQLRGYDPVPDGIVVFRFDRRP